MIFRILSVVLVLIILSCSSGTNPKESIPNSQFDIALVVGKTSRIKLIKKNHRTGDIYLLLDNITKISYPHWSPNGEDILFISDNNPYYSQFYIYSNLSNRYKTIESSGFITGNPSWSHDSKRFTYGFEQNQYSSLVITNIDGSDDKHFRNDDFEGYLQPQWSPNGDLIVFQTKWSRKLGIFNLADSSFTTLLESEGAPSDPRWSPDGLKIAYSLGSSPNPGIYIVNADGSDNRYLSQEVGYCRYPVWSPDDLKVSFSRLGTDNNHKYCYYDLSNREEITIDETMDNYGYIGTWSSDSKLVAYNIEKSGKETMIIYNIETQKSNEILIGDLSIFTGSFRP